MCEVRHQAQGTESPPGCALCGHAELTASAEVPRQQPSLPTGPGAESQPLT